MKKLLIISSFLTISIGLSSTVQAQRVRKYYETFYVGERGTQYFIKPLELASENTSDALLLDITFRYKQDVTDTVVINFSVIGESIYKKLDQFVMKHDAGTVAGQNIKQLYSEKHKKGFLSRYTLQVTTEELYQLFSSKNGFSITLKQGSEINMFSLTGKGEKSVIFLIENLFVLF